MIDIATLLARTPGWGRLAEAAGLEAEDVTAILAEAERFAAVELAPLAARADVEGCRLASGRVATPAGYAAAWRGLGAAGFVAADLPEALGGAGLPLPLHVAASLHLEAAAMPFMMVAGATRAAAHCLAAIAPGLAARWAPRLASGSATATIAISEPDAGSDVGRIRTRATREADGWRIDGTKCWISFGDHDMTDDIVHLLLARTGAMAEGTRGLSLFLVPSRVDGGPNGITVERIEEKLGLHGSPTCVLRFDGAHAEMLGEAGRGLPALFAMIELMRLQTGTQGAGIALASADLARRYAGERRQGGDPAGPPVAIATHADVRRQLTALDTRAALLSALVLETAVALGLARAGDDEAAARAAFLLPLAKNFGGEEAFAAASGAIQVLGGAGYTREWPAERHLRDARVITIYEGTTFMQAQDFLIRRLVRDGGRGLESVLAAARAELAPAAGTTPADTALAVLARFEALAGEIAGWPAERLALAADGFLRAGWCAVGALLAARLAAADGALAPLGRFHLATAGPRMALAEASCRRDPADLAG